MPKITPNLWFNNNAEEAVNFYLSVFKNGNILRTDYYTNAGKEIHGHNAGDVLTIEFELDGQEFVALNGGPEFPFNESISFIVDCETQEEIDYYWEKLSADPAAEQCGWLKDKYGVSWQIIPTILNEMLRDSDPAKVERVTNAFLPMKKLDIAALKRAYEEQ